MSNPHQDAHTALAQAQQQIEQADALVKDVERQVSERKRTGRPAGRRTIDKPAHAWSTAQLADWIGMSSGFVLTEINAGEIKASNFGGSYRIHTTEVRRYLESKGFPTPSWMQSVA